MTPTRPTRRLLAGFLCTVATTALAGEPTTPTLSSEITEAVSATFTYRTPEQREEDRQAAADASAYIDQPKNRIIRLPRVVVEGERPPIFHEKTIHSPEALTEIAMKRYISDFGRALNSWRIPIIGGAIDGYAMMLYEQDERIRIMREISEEISLDLLMGEDERAAELRAILQGKSIRPIIDLNPGQVPLRDARGQ